MTHAFDLSATEHAWWAARDAHRISTAALLREALPALGLSGGHDNPYGALSCTLPSLPDTAPGEVRIAVTGDGAEVVIRGMPLAPMREVLVHSAGICFAPFTAETSLGRTPSRGKFSTRAHGAAQRLTVRTGAVADATLTLPMLVAARALRPVAAHIRSVSGR
ncbi:hypothetical protein [Streptomyces anulatus]|uniref:hypothetical protein n=1 Tax=Streptomyces anulatus TaxID=1892 RepID=UPI001C274DED|nr:hypothetical protein [Streptomyces anulatus]